MSDDREDKNINDIFANNNGVIKSDLKPFTSYIPSLILLALGIYLVKG